MSDAADAPTPPTRRRWPAAALCVALALLFAFHGWWAASTKSPTFDEPVHTLSAWLIVNRGDFRLNPEHPALWKYLAGLPLVGFPLTADLDAPAARAPLALVEAQWPWMAETLFRTPGNDGVALVGRARMAMAVVPFLLALVVARWAWALAGPTAAVVATAALSLDPNLLAHAALVTNDTAATLAFTLAAYLTWQVGRRFTWPRAAGLVATCAVGVGVKATCVLLVATVGLPLAIRMLARWRDAADRRTISPARFLAIGLGAAILGYVLLWPAYQFRAAPTPAGDRFDAPALRAAEAYYEVVGDALRAGEPISREAALARVPGRPPSKVSGAIHWLEDRRLLPQAFSVGVLHAQTRGISRPTYLLGEVRPTGSHAYFPLALAWKTPLAVLAATAVAVVALPSALRRAGASTRWALVCLVVPPAIYFAVMVAANLNIGLRHALPVLPPLYVALGVAAQRAIAWRPRAGPATVVGAIAVLAVEVLSTCPNYLAFFNVAAGGARGGLARLGDSNLDWGQDLPALAEYYATWRRGNAGAPFYLSYFGSVDPRVYGIDYVNASPGYPLARAAPSDAYLQTGGTLAVSATALQGLVDEPSRPLMATLRGQEPLDVINGSIYIFRIAPAGAGRP